MVNWLKLEPSLVKDDQGATADTSPERHEVIGGKRNNRNNSVKAGAY